MSGVKVRYASASLLRGRVCVGPSPCGVDRSRPLIIPGDEAPQCRQGFRVLAQEKAGLSWPYLDLCTVWRSLGTVEPRIGIGVVIADVLMGA